MFSQVSVILFRWGRKVGPSWTWPTTPLPLWTNNWWAPLPQTKDCWPTPPRLRTVELLRPNTVDMFSPPPQPRTADLIPPPPHPDQRLDPTRPSNYSNQMMSIWVLKIQWHRATLVSKYRLILLADLLSLSSKFEAQFAYISNNIAPAKVKVLSLFLNEWDTRKRASVTHLVAGQVSYLVHSDSSWCHNIHLFEVDIFVLWKIAKAIKRLTFFFHTLLKYFFAFISVLT